MAVNDTKKARVKNTTLIERDILILYQLYEKVSLTSSQIHTLCFKGLGLGCTYKALSKLKQLKLVITARYDLGRLGKLEDLFFVSKKGVNCLIHSGMFEDDDFAYKVKDTPNLIVDYAHRIAINDYWIELEGKMARQKRYKLALFVPEFKKLENGKTITLRHVLDTGKVLQVRNDAIFIVLDTKSELEYLFLLEVDRGTMPISCSEKLKNSVENNCFIRSNLETKLEKIRQILGLGSLAFIGLGRRFEHFCGARVVLVRGGK